MTVKVIVVLMLLLILGSLASAMLFLVRDRGQSDRTVRALTLRIALSGVLVLFLLIGFALGLLRPHGL